MNYLKLVTEKVEESRAITGVLPEDTLESLGFDSLEVAELEIELENSVNFYTASTRSWLFKTDSIEDAAAKLKHWHMKTLKQYDEANQNSQV